ncbi:hypothetical protein [Paenibacillus beijingensis]|uniref:Uncharacterized protein n=1 Tax=Paenibacillus beijingensis TaxID=1126833 RepID=A0A0D5NPW0_9BACL|nr:hypothetical protein [Paenibacillus beijingensis]AJY77190.1 hypothetical protein VN24_24845 [Paenibacillus beijingensis]
MNGIHDGYITFFLLLLSFILLTTGWNRELAEELTWKQAAFFAAGWFVTQPAVSVLAGGAFILRGSVLWTLGASVFVCMRGVRGRHPGYIFFCSVLLGMFWVWVEALYNSDPLLEIFDSRLDVPLLCGSLATLLVQQAGQQFVVITLASAVKSILSASILTGAVVEAGSWNWWDGYFLALASARLTSIVFRYFAALAALLFNNREGDV